MKQRIKRKALAVLAALVIAVGLLPVTAFAENPNGEYSVTPASVSDFAMLSGLGNYRFDFSIPEGAAFKELKANNVTLKQGIYKDYTCYSDTYITLTDDFCCSLRDKFSSEGKAFTVELIFIFEDEYKQEVPVTVNLNFPDTVALTIENGSGGEWRYNEYSYSGPESVIYLPENEPVMLTAGAYGLYKFAGWQIGDKIYNEETHTFNLSENTTAKILTEPRKSALTLSTDHIDFGSVYVGDSGNPPEAKTVTLTNSGEVPLVLQKVESEKFDIVGIEPYSYLGVEQSCTFTVRPKADLSAGVHDEALVITGYLYDEPVAQRSTTGIAALSNEEVLPVPEQSDFSA